MVISINEQVVMTNTADKLPKILTSITENIVRRRTQFYDIWNMISYIVIIYNGNSEHIVIR